MSWKAREDGEDMDRTDLERIGLFQEGPYDLTVTFFRPDISKIMGRDDDEVDDPLRLDGPWMPCDGFKMKAATNDWVFSPFLYLWEEEPYEDPGAWRRAYNAEQKELDISDEPFISAFGAKSMNGLGTYYGTFSAPFIEAFDPETKDEEIDDRLQGVANFLTNPGKKGTGYGYADVTINPFTEWEEDPLYDLTEARREMREEFEAAMIGDTWIPTAHPGGYFDPNPFGDPDDPDGEIETYDWDRLAKDEDDFLDGPWIPNSHTKWINGNKDVIDPLEKFPEHDPVDEYEAVQPNPFRQRDPDLDLDGPWKAQFGNRTYPIRSVTQYNVNLWVNPTTFHLF